MNDSVPNVKKAKAIHQERQAHRDAQVSAMKRESVGTRLQDTIKKAYRGSKARGR